jgi:hypothetical protein
MGRIPKINENLFGRAGAMQRGTYWKPRPAHRPGVQHRNLAPCEPGAAARSSKIGRSRRITDAHLAAFLASLEGDDAV